MRTSPLVGGSSPPIMRNSVVLPHPEGPSSTRNSPSADARSMPSTAATPSKRLLRSRTSTTAMARGDGQTARRPDGKEKHGRDQRCRRATHESNAQSLDPPHQLKVLTGV